MNFVYLGLFIVITGIHLYGTIKNNYSLRSATKGMLLLLLLGFYLESVPQASVFMVVALIMSWAGDVLLIPHGLKWFTAGGIAFMIGHLFFVFEYNTDINFANVPVWLIILLGALFAAAVVFIFSKLKVYLLKQIIVPMFLYLLINGTMNCFAIYRMISCFSLATLTTVVGALLFFVSDTALFFVRFNKNSVMKSHFLVMLTYTLGELLIVLGVVM